MSTMTCARTDEFLKVVRKSALINPEELEAFEAQLWDESGAADEPRTLAKRLLAEGLLTHFQCEQLLRGRWRNFHLAGKYKVLERLGTGPMSTVLLCEHVTMRRLVALKLLPVDKAKDPVILSRFHKEAQAAARLRHPNVITVHDLDMVGDLNFQVSEFVDGSDLRRVVEISGPLSISRAANYLAQAADGLQHAHEMGLVHRDVKPANLILDRSGTVKLLDLGLARLFSKPEVSHTISSERGMLLGTIDFLAPEQAADSRTVDIRADIYSLGASAFYLLSGRTLFDGASTIQKLLMHSQRPAEPIVLGLPGIPREFAEILIKMLAKDPNDRYQTPAEVAQAMAPWITEIAHLPSASEMPKYSPATRRAIERSGTSIVPSNSRASSRETPSGFQWPAIAVDEKTATASEIRLIPDEKSGSSRRNWLISHGVLVAVGLVMATLGFFKGRDTQASLERSRVAGLSSDLKPGEIPLISQGDYLKIDLQPVASVVTTRAMFHEPDGPQASDERLVLDDWSPRSFHGVPFQLVDPKGETTPNAIMLYSPQGVTPPRMPSTVCLKVNTRASAIHFLGGISGWGAKCATKSGTTSMIVRLLYNDGKVEDHPLKNGVHFSDFVQIADLPGSSVALRFKNRHLRYFSITPGRSEKITQIELIKGPDATAPIVMAMTLEKPGKRETALSE